ncbi:hypothetical protein FQN57_005659 [Myotisia sp. PD_48]|nr:hypothetical protein FQN57_005659 [Myotisia sp. PD_48]
MPVSHITLTVSNLPASTSFFLSCLQPLGYCFIGRHDNNIGFGAEPGKPADFWISEERPGTPAGAAHIAFPAPSREAVRSFFIAALKAGGKIHGEPCMRDAEQGYYSAAVVDFDGNSIEAVHRGSSGSSRANPDKVRSVVENGSVVSHRSSKSKAPTAISSMKQETVIAPAMASRKGSVVSVHREPTSPPTVVSQKASNENSLNGAKAVMGTLLGAAAGAAIAYAMVKGDTHNERHSTAAPPQYAEATAAEVVPMAYKTIEAISLSGGGPRSIGSKNLDVNSVYEGLEHASRIIETAKSLTGGSKIGGASAVGGSTYSASREMDIPLRAIEGIPAEYNAYDDYYDDGRTMYTRAYPYNPSTFISSFAERPRRDSGYISQAGSAIPVDQCCNRSKCSSSASTIKPSKSRSKADSVSVRSNRSSHSTKETYPKASSAAQSYYSSHSSHSARNVPLPSSQSTTLSASPTHSSKSSRSRHTPIHESYEYEYEYDQPPRRHSSSASSKLSYKSAQHVPLPASTAGASTIFLPGGVDVDSHVTPTPRSSRSRSHTSKMSSHSRRSRSSGRHKASGLSTFSMELGSTKSGRSKKSSSIFDEVVLPSDSVSQIGSSTSSRRSGKSSRR